MTDEKIQLIAGGLLHDIGKVLENPDKKKHEEIGYDYLKDKIPADKKEILDFIKYHHNIDGNDKELLDHSLVFIIYLANQMASVAEQKQEKSRIEQKQKRSKIERKRKKLKKKIEQRITPLESVFNILNGNEKRCYYCPGILGKEEEIFMPGEQKKLPDAEFYKKIQKNLTEGLSKIKRWTAEYMNSLLEIMETNFSYVSSCPETERADISLYDHVKMTTAFGCCIYDYLLEQGVTNYREKLYQQQEEFCRETVFLLLSMDISGIQNFIYTIYSEGALKNLRARSFYLEIMMEHIVDTLLERLELSRANLIYSGGGHCYILLPNTKKVHQVTAELEEELNGWLLEQFGISLYVAIGTKECSAENLRDIPQGSYSDIFRGISNSLSEKKARRYGAEQIRRLNQRNYKDYSRECKVCRRLDQLNEENECKMCAAIARISKNILYTDFFLINKKEEEDSLALPFGGYLIAEGERQMLKRLEKEDKEDAFIRIYSKNQMYIEKYVATKLWVGNYTTKETFEEFAEQAEGIERIGILRADVDNLGKTFVSGFEHKKYGNQYVTLSRTAALSRQLSLFFKYHINQILSEAKFCLNKQEKGKRKVTIVYSGGDDLFLVGAWDDVLESAVDIKTTFEQYTEGTLSLSAGIGMYQPGFPIHVSAEEVAELEEDSKMLPGKNAVTFFKDGRFHKENDPDSQITYQISDGTYSWQVFVDEVWGEKYQTIYQFFQNSEDRGKNFLYHLLELIREQGETINLARYVYLLSRMEPEQEDEKELYQDFSKQMYRWIKEEKDCRQLKTAITLYSYLFREREA